MPDQVRHDGVRLFSCQVNNSQKIVTLVKAGVRHLPEECVFSLQPICLNYKLSAYVRIVKQAVRVIFLS